MQEISKFCEEKIKKIYKQKKKKTPKNFRVNSKMALSVLTDNKMPVYKLFHVCKSIFLHRLGNIKIRLLCSQPNLLAIEEK